MFNIILDPNDFIFAGCPRSGLDAVDWRIRNGLRPAPTNRVEQADFPMSLRPSAVPGDSTKMENIEGTDEGCVRCHGILADDDADLDLCGLWNKLPIRQAETVVPIEADEIGTIADLANATIRAYRELVRRKIAENPEIEDTHPVCGLLLETN